MPPRSRRPAPPAPEVHPFGMVALSVFGHMATLGILIGFSAIWGQQMESKTYIVNLVPSLPSPAPAPSRAPAAPRPVAAPTPAAPPKPKAEEPPKAVKAPERVERTLPPRREEAPAAATRPAPKEIVLPKRAVKETPALETPGLARAIERRPPAPPPPPAPSAREVTRAPEPPAPPPPRPTAAQPEAAPQPPVAPLEPVRLGRGETAATGSISLDVSDFPFTWYLRQVQQKISERWVPPRGSVAGGETVVVLFEIGRNGEIKGPEVERPSGNFAYDQSAVRAIKEASPFPPLPAEFRAGSLRVHFGFEFRPEQG